MTVTAAQAIVGTTVPGPHPAISYPRAAVSLQKLLADCHRQYGDVFHIHTPVIGRVVMLADPDDIRTLYLADSTGASAARAFSIRHFVSRGTTIAELEGDEHRRRRRLLHPLHHGEHLARYEPMIADVVRSHTARWRSGEVVRVRDFAMEVASEVQGHMLFGPASAVRYAEYIRGLCRFWPLVLMVPARVEPARLPGPFRRFAQLRRGLRDLFEVEIAGRRTGADGATEDLCAHLVAAAGTTEAPLPEDHLRDELMLAGLPTLLVAASIQWMFDHVLHAPSVSARLQADPDDMPLLNAVVEESMRLNPPAEGAPRFLIGDLDIRDFRLRAGEAVSPAIHLVHRRPDLYERPHEFRPDRFLETRPKTFGWLCFGGGQRRCLGASVAQLSLRVILQETLREWSVRPVNARRSASRRVGIVMRPAGGVPMIVTRRVGG